MLLEREDLMEGLHSALNHVFSSGGRVLIIEGEAGIGKTALLQAFCRSIDGTCTVHWGWSDPFTTPRPLGALHDMAATIGADIAAVLRSEKSADDIFPYVLNSFLSIHMPMVLVFEDVHWADNASIDFIRFLGRRVSLLKVLIILTVRRSDLDRDHPVTHLLGDLLSGAASRLTMTPLSPAAVATLASDENNINELYAATGGNPFFVTELLADGNGVRGQHLPVSVRDAVWARWSRLPPELRDFLDIVSILPRGAPPLMIPLLAGDDGLQVAEQCIERGLLRRDEKGALVFRHELARQATLERLSAQKQRALHGQMDEILLGLASGNGDPNILSQRLHHVALSGDVARILELAPRAAAQAALLGAHEQAARCLAIAIKHVALASPTVAAQLYEDWAQETFLAGYTSSEETLGAFRTAIALWRSQSDIRKVGLNLCRLARLHWRRGETGQAVSYTEQAVGELETLAATRELALAYSTRSQFLMLQDRFEDAIIWGKRAIELADELKEIETRIHALNNVGTSLTLSGDPGGDDLLAESLSLSLTLGYHDHASRAYTNLSECYMVFRDFTRADKLMTDGIAFCVQHDLDAAANYLLGRHAQLRMEQGRLIEAQMIAQGVVAKDGFPRVMRLPALSVLGRVNMRLGHSNGLELLTDALEQGYSTGEPQRIIPVRLAMIEAAWLQEQKGEAGTHIEALTAMGEQLSSWDLGEFAVWCKRLAYPPPTIKAGILPEPRLAELEDDFERAARVWTSLDQPYEAALSLIQVTGDGAPGALSRAVKILDAMDAKPAAYLARQIALRNGLGQAIPKLRRGPYAAARQHPLGLTAAEQKVLTLVIQGMGNKDIARTLTRSLRTVEHQVSSVLAKFNASNRMEVLLRVRSEPWLAE